MIGFVGSGNMASAIARGLGEPVLCTDAYPEKARALAEELGGEAIEGNGLLADRADVVVLGHKPQQLHEVAEQLGGRARRIISILGGVSLDALKSAYGTTPVVRVLPSTPVAVREGVTVIAEDPQGDAELTRLTTELFERLGTVVTVTEEQMGAAMGLMSCAPAYMALVAEAQIDAGIKAGLPAPVAQRLATQTMLGTAKLIAHEDFDTLAVRRQVTSPGGTTARGLAALERGGVRAAFLDAMDEVTSR